MKGNPAVPGGSLKSKPTWSNTSGCSTTSVFFCVRRPGPGRDQIEHMDKSDVTMAQQIARAASAFERQRTGHAPKSVTVVLSEDTLVITLRGALSPAEKAAAQSPGGAAQMQEFHRQLFRNSCGSLQQDIQRITGVEVREATAEIETATGAVMQVFATGTVVQVFLLAHSVPGEAWSGSVA
jgi:uncharacterized protein YbcI